MAYKYWKMMEKVGVAVCSQKLDTWRGKEQFDGYIFEADDKKARESAEDWARRYDNRWNNDKETIVYEPNVHIFDNEGFTVTILDSAGGSSQGGRLSFWKCKVEKDGVEFIVGVNDSILADLIRNSDLEKGKVKQEVMFVRKGGQPGFIHEKMEAYEEAVADMKKKSDLKSAKKTKKWEIGGVYSTLTQTDICLGEVYDTMEEYEEEQTYQSGWRYGGYGRKITKLRKAKNPKKVLAWVRWYNFGEDKELPTSLEELLKKELEGNYHHFSTGVPPSRAKASQLEVKESDLALIDQLTAIKEEYNDGYDYNAPKKKGRYVRELK